MDRDAAEKALVNLARQSAAAWQQIRGEAFRGTTTIETDNTLYHFVDGVFAARARKPAPGVAPAWESPPSMRGLELIGFLADAGSLWSLSPRWRPGSLAVMWRLGSDLDHPFTLTSPTSACAVEPPAAPRRSGPPTARRRPPAASVTRLQQSPQRKELT